MLLLVVLIVMLVSLGFGLMLNIKILLEGLEFNVEIVLVFILLLYI